MSTKQLARWATNLKADSLPPSVRQAALRSLYNYIGCAIGGSNHPTVRKAHAALSPFFGTLQCTLLGAASSTTCTRDSDRRTDAQHAAVLNGIASHVHDYDDTHLATIIHPTGPVASAILAYAEHLSAGTSSSVGGLPGKGVSGEAVLTALVAGIEAACKLGLAVWPSHYDVGWHITSTTGSIGAAVGVGKLMQLCHPDGLSEEAMAHAIGIGAVQVTGLREMFGSDTKSLHPGRAAQAGLMAALLAQAGYTSSEQALEAKRGWANVVCPGEPQLGKYIAIDGEETLSKVWEIERNAFKPFPCGIVCHPIIDGCIQLHKEMNAKGLKIEDVTEVVTKVHPLVIELTSKRKPKDGLEGKFSVFHGGAVGLLFGKAGPAQYADDVVTSPEVVALRDKIDAETDEKLAADETYIKLRFTDGTELQKHIDHAVGSLQVPMTDEQLTEKFVDQVSLVMGSDGAKAASEAAWDLGNATNVADVLRTL